MSTKQAYQCANGLVLVLLLAPYGSLNAGDVAGFPEATAKSIVDGKSPFGEYYVPSAEEIELKRRREAVRRRVLIDRTASQMRISPEEAEARLKETEELTAAAVAPKTKKK